MQEGINKEVLANKLKYDRLIADTIANEKMLESEKQAVKELLMREAFQKEKDLRLALDAELQTAVDVANANKLEKEKTNELARQEMIKTLTAQNQANAKKANDERLAEVFNAFDVSLASF